MNDLAVYVCACQPITLVDEQNLIDLAMSARRVMIVISSADRPRTIHSPFSLTSRRHMVEVVDQSLTTALGRSTSPFITVTLNDFPGDDVAWDECLGELINHTMDLHDIKAFEPEIRIASNFGTKIVGAPIDIDGPLKEAGALRQSILSGESDYVRACSPKVAAFITRWSNARVGAAFREDFAVTTRLNDQYGTGPFYAVDVIVKKGGRVLTIRRGGQPCRGTFAFPGGFIDPGETPIHAAQRELGEETNIGAVLFGLPLDAPVPFTPVASVHMDQPNRDPRYEDCHTTAFLVELPDDGNYPEITGHDDAMPNVSWTSIRDLAPDIMWADSGYFLRRLLKAA